MEGHFGLAETRFETTLLDSVDSTSTWLKGLGPIPWTAARAATQTAGRGRRGRAWASGPGGLWISFALPAGSPGRPWPAPGAFTLAAGLAVLGSVEASFPEALGLSLKWPNDLVGPGPVKAGGILAEMAMTPGGGTSENLPVVIVGIGINVANDPPEGLDLPAMSLARLSEISAAEAKSRLAPLASRLAVAMATAHEEFSRHGLSEMLKRYASRCSTIGSRVIVNGDYEALAIGIADDGGLIVDRGGETGKIISGEVSIRQAGTPSD